MNKHSNCTHNILQQFEEVLAVVYYHYHVVLSYILFKKSRNVLILKSTINVWFMTHRLTSKRQLVTVSYLLSARNFPFSISIPFSASITTYR